MLFPPLVLRNQGCKYFNSEVSFEGEIKMRDTNIHHNLLLRSEPLDNKILFSVIPTTIDKNDNDEIPPNTNTNNPSYSIPPSFALPWRY